MTELVCIKVKIGKKPNGHADYPVFNQLPSVKAANKDWSHYVDDVGGGWHYDKASGHDHEDLAAQSPRGMQWGCLLVDEQFADEAVAAFPGIVTEINEAAFADFHDNRAHAHEPSVRENREAIQYLVNRKALGEIVPQEEIDAALDPDDPAPGRKRNPTKTWAGRKADMGITIKLGR